MNHMGLREAGKFARGVDVVRLVLWCVAMTNAQRMPVLVAVQARVHVPLSGVGVFSVALV